MTSILDDDFCYYCQKRFESPKKLQQHILRTHKGTYAESAVIQAREDETEYE